MTKKQLEVLNMYVNFPRMTDVEIANRLGMSATYLSNLRKKEPFMEELKKQLSERWADAARQAQENMQNIANTGKGLTAYKANEYILNSAGYQAPQEIKIDSNVIKVSIDDD